MSRDLVARTYGPLAGFKLGIVVLRTRHPLLPGNVQNATSFPFPVIYEIVDVPFPHLMTGDSNCDEPIKQAVLNLEQQGVKMIVGACGSFANWQTRVTAYASVPAYMSIMSQLPFVLTGLPSSQKLGVIFADAAAFTHRVREECRISDADAERLVILHGGEISGFDAFLQKGDEASGHELEQAFVQYLLATARQHPEIGAWLFQCSDLPPYSVAAQRATNLPVFDMTTLINHLFLTVAQAACNPPPTLPWNCQGLNHF